MKKTFWVLLGMLTIAFVFSTWTFAADTTADVYKAKCAACHGADGKDTGPLSAKLDNKPTDLTLLAKHNHGTFDAGAIYQKIDGRNPAQKPP